MVKKQLNVRWELNAGIDLLEYRPSEVAAAVAISAAGEAKTLDNEKAISMLIQHVHLVKVYHNLVSLVVQVPKERET